MKSDLLDRWPELVSALVAAIDSEWSRGGPLHHWRKGDSDQVVSDLDLRLDIAIRTTLSSYYPRLPVLSEELGWLHPDEKASTLSVAVVDPVDGTDSLVQHRDSWWTSVALLKAGVPQAGIIYQPTTGVSHDSHAPRDKPPASGAIGLSPDQFEEGETPALRRSGGLEGFAVVPVPHAVEKVAAVVEGRCDASLFLPSRKSPGWSSWDLAAVLAIARANGALLRAADGGEIHMDDLNAYQRVPWICARDPALWEAIQAALITTEGDEDSAA